MLTDLIFDVGLHKGEDSAYYLARGFRVVAIEADIEHVELCRSRFSEEISSNRMTIVHGAIVEDESLEEITFFKNKNNSVWGTVVQAWADRNTTIFNADSVPIRVPVVDIRQLFSDHGCPYYLKIDIEGMDLVCLRKLLSTGCRPRYISIESDMVSFRALREEFNTFTALGYRSFFVQQQRDINRRTVPLNSNEGVYIDYTFEEGSSGPFGSDLEGPWLSEKEALAKYRSIFTAYRLFGINGFIRRFPFTRYVLKALSKLLRHPIRLPNPGWHDTHARID